MLKRFSISLEENLLDSFDTYIKAQSYNNRSEAIRDLIRKALVRQAWLSDSDVMGVITLVYDHHQHQLQEKVTELQHGHHHHIVSTTHVHMDHHNCLEVIIVRGKAKEVQELADKLIALRGVRDGNLAMSSTGQDLH
ncbi:MAG: nickel-responsive transcriptional regulator NikR [Desulfopila sp.]|jgi:CopG family transcriptional regulator, nickel-responsive regulator|nr:nickel-responsive transcriptional regulator NikR [Desulfopila sp.]